MSSSDASVTDARSAGQDRVRPQLSVHRGAVLEAIPCRASSVTSRALDGEAVLVHAEQKKVTVLNGVGARLWELADGQRSIADIARVIADEYEVSLVKAEADALVFCSDLARRGLLTISS